MRRDISKWCNHVANSKDRNKMPRDISTWFIFVANNKDRNKMRREFSKQFIHVASFERRCEVNKPLAGIVTRDRLKETNQSPEKTVFYAMVLIKTGIQSQFTTKQTLLFRQ